MKLIVGISGASGVIYGVEFLKKCKSLGVETHLILSKWAKKNIEFETDWKLEEVGALADYIYEDDNLAAAPSSGSFLHNGMVIIPCSMKTMSAIANGYSHSLLARAADVTLKEQRTLVLVPRETPLNAIHLENMLKLARLGVAIAPPMPAFYHCKTIDEVIQHTVGRLLDLFGIKNELTSRWQGTEDM